MLTGNTKGTHELQGILGHLSRQTTNNNLRKMVQAYTISRNKNCRKYNNRTTIPEVILRYYESGIDAQELQLRTSVIRMSRKPQFTVYESREDISQILPRHVFHASRQP